MPAQKSGDNNAFRNLPSVDELVRSNAGRAIAAAAGERHAAKMARETIARLRKEFNKGTPNAKSSKADALTAALTIFANKWTIEQGVGINRVINATGVVIHTNLGRSPLSERARQAVADAAGYCSLEFDLSTGRRGPRGKRAEDLIVELTGADDALIVNNCAAAAFFVLTAFASGGEVIISRGEMVEIGGDFRVPEVLAQSGCTLREVGTTNRTKLADYERAVRAGTKAILRVHPSNYRVVGFTASPTLSDLANLARKKKLLLYEDIGSGALADLTAIGLGDEPVVSRSIADGADVVTFSGDKLLGGPQAGIIAGRRKLIAVLRKHPLYRALRVDKLTYGALEATLESHRRGMATTEVPTLRMLSSTKDDIGKRVDRFLQKLERSGCGVRAERLDGISAVGGGAAPAVELETVLIALQHPSLRPAQLEAALRASTPPVIARVAKDRVLLDLRTVPPEDENELVAAISNISDL